MSLPVIFDRGGNLAIPDQDTGELVSLREASDRALLTVAEEIAELDRQTLEAKRALAAELRERHGVGTAHAAGFGFKVAESTSWPEGKVRDTLNTLVNEGRVSEADAERCWKSKPDATQLKALAGRLTLSDPEAARMLAQACTTSPPSVRDVKREAVDAEAA